ncbi:hypothetical protein BABINDRAFT_126977 [Babjeviella inositovora NRRL Y-12698]|uniref:Uncharacterized protein n=1 Tax=Babjeviella inositovora NRRL Y-12698 TaxID=984486 RepID=A0A1E3QSW6_9ASCO|nr:uncharacterized protein BABINDRAFT_126977 [Babjeviella inositovora NRRL Y-12698]ODQ80771.1 hypothetical protein BABINDRAFT_126977 [Babjeviella inositovora NRRL Y-12698]
MIQGACIVTHLCEIDLVCQLETPTKSFVGVRHKKSSKSSFYLPRLLYYKSLH